MPKTTTTKKIGIFSHAGTKNLGDEALFATVIQNIRLRIPDAEIVGFTVNPADSQHRHGVPCFPIRRPDHPPAPAPTPQSPAAQDFQTRTTDAQKNPAGSFLNALKSVPGLRGSVRVLRRFARTVIGIVSEPKFLLDSYRRLRGIDLLIFSGGQQLNDNWGGAWAYPFTLYKWTVIAGLTGTRLAMLSVGAGPLDTPLGKIFVRRIVRRLNYRSYRDAVSSRLIESLGVEGSHPVFPDLAYSMKMSDRPAAQTGSQRKTVAINPIPFLDVRYWPTHDTAGYQSYVRKFVQFAEWLEKTGHSVLFFPTQFRADALTINDIRAAMNGLGQSPRLLQRPPIQGLEDLLSTISEADFVVANRYHGILISLMMNKPVLGLAYMEKSRALLTQAGQGAYVLNIADFTAEDLIERFESLEQNAPALKKQIAERMNPLRKALDEQYDAVFALIGVKPSASEHVS